MIYDPAPTLFYRQHGRNEVGANQGARAALYRLGFLLSGRFRDWTEANLAALEAAQAEFTPEARQILQDFAALRQLPLLPRLRAFRRLGLYRQSRAAQATMWLGLLLGRL